MLPDPADQDECAGSGPGESPAHTSTDHPDSIFDSRVYQITHCDGHKVDVIEKGFKNTHRLFLTTADLEEK
jgi:hypothetical protein